MENFASSDMKRETDSAKEALRLKFGEVFDELRAYAEQASVEER
jgi:hypothetical protein